MLRRDRVAHRHFRAPTAVPGLGAVLCAFLAGPLDGRDPSDYRIAGVLLVIGIGLWAVTWILNRARYGRPTRLHDVEHLGEPVDR